MLSRALAAGGDPAFAVPTAGGVGEFGEAALLQPALGEAGPDRPEMKAVQSYSPSPPYSRVRFSVTN